VTPAGQVLDDPPIEVLAAGSTFALTSNGSDWLVVGQGDSGTGILAARVSPAGTVLDPGGALLVPSTFFLYFNINVASAGGEYLLTYTASSAFVARRFDADLAPIGTVFSLPGTTVASSGSEYFLTWSSGGSLVGSPMAIDGTLLVPGGTSFATSGPTYDVNSSWGGTQWWTTWSSGEAHVIWRDYRAGALSPDDVYGALVSASAVPAPEVPISLGAPTQVQPDLAAGAGGYAVAFESEDTGVRRLLAHRLDASGASIDPEPTVLATGTNNYALGRPDVAWNGSVYLFTWSENGTIYGRRMLPDGTFLDLSRFAIMAGSMPDAHALGDVFLVAGVVTSGQFASPFAVRVEGATGAILDPTPILTTPSCRR
jgi:hypothetical protein